MNEALIRKLLLAQRNEITESGIYSWLAGRIQDKKNREVLERIAKEELGHYEILKRLTKTDVKPRKFRKFWYTFISRILGLSFGLRLMEQGEKIAEDLYGLLKDEIPEIAEIFVDEHRHETEILGLIQEERIEYAGSIVLGLNDALMELTGALAGLTFALQNGKIIAVTGFITGVAASMSMAASEFLSVREETDENTRRNALKSAAYTGITYIVTVFILISPYFLFSSVYASLAAMIALSVIIILGYNFYIATAKGLKLWRRFSEMALISLGVAAISFLVGVVVRTFIGVDI